MFHPYYRVTKSFMAQDVTGSVPMGRWWFNVDTVLDVVEEIEDENGWPAVSVRTPGTLGLFVVRKTKLTRQCAEISSEDWEFVVRQLDLPMWQWGQEQDIEIMLPWKLTEKRADFFSSNKGPTAFH